MTTTHAVPTRVQLALNVDDVVAATEFYRQMLGVEPAKVRPGYANFAVDSPPLKLVLIENPGATDSLNHLGVELASTDEVDAQQRRLSAAGLTSYDERGTTCCYAVQDKFWVDGAPDGERWEYYTVLADAPVLAPVATAEGTACCAVSAEPACC
jgi:catechol 2,3-dioxygenase-like lactoylglutathione lyase family enzyme